jgi:hypothetical protein
MLSLSRRCLDSTSPKINTFSDQRAGKAFQRPARNLVTNVTKIGLFLHSVAAMLQGRLKVLRKKET